MLESSHQRALIQSYVSDTEDLAQTQEIGPLDQAQLRSALFDACLTRLRAVEAINVRLVPDYRRHSDRDLLLLVRKGLSEHRNPTQMVTELLIH